MTLSVVIITYNEEANIGRTLASVQELVRGLGGEIIVVDSGSTDRTRQIAESFGAKVFVEDWKGFAAQKNSAIEKASGEWILSLDADEEISTDLREEIRDVVTPRQPSFAHLKETRYRFDRETNRGMRRTRRRLQAEPQIGEAVPGKIRGTLVAIVGYRVPRKNMFLGRWMRHGGFWPDRKLRIFHREITGVQGDRLIRESGARFEHERLVHEDAKTDMPTGVLRGALIHHAYPTLDIYLEHMRRYADLGAEMIRHKPSPILLLNRWFNPPLTFLYNYIVRLGFLDGREGFLLHWNHSRYVSWKYAKALELSRSNR